jgi:hypothetical protein
VTICHRLTALLAKSLFQVVPILSSCLKVGLLRQHLNDVHDGEEPGLRLLVVGTANSLLLEYGRKEFIAAPLMLIRTLALLASSGGDLLNDPSTPLNGCSNTGGRTGRWILKPAKIAKLRSS